jgi:hypothetical protein
MENHISVVQVASRPCTVHETVKKNTGHSTDRLANNSNRHKTLLRPLTRLRPLAIKTMRSMMMMKMKMKTFPKRGLTTVTRTKRTRTMTKMRSLTSSPHH